MNTQKPQAVFNASAYAGVRQDKSVPLIKRSASPQGYRGSKGGQSNSISDQSLVPFTTPVVPGFCEINKRRRELALCTAVVHR